MAFHGVKVQFCPDMLEIIDSPEKVVALCMAKKSKYETHVLPNLGKIEAWAKQGVTTKEIAANLNIAYSTFRKYLEDGENGDERYSALSALYAQACEVSNKEVENSLYKLANGYTAQVAKTFKVKIVEYDEQTGKKIREYEELQTGIDEVHVPANVTAQMFWLANRVPDRWKYKPGEEKDDPEDDNNTGVVMIPEVGADDG